MTYDHIDIYESTIAIDGTTIHGIKDDAIPFPQGSTGTKDVSTQDDGTVMRKGLKRFDPGSVDIVGFIISNDAGQTALWDAYGDRALHTITVTIPDAGEVYSYKAYVSKFVPGNDENSYTFTATLEVSGQPTRSTTTAGITSIEGAGAGIAYFPVNANSALSTSAGVVIFHEANGVTTDTVEVTAASASAIEISYDSGSTWTALSTGVASTFSTTYYPAAGAVAEAVIKVEEADKATRFVKLLIVQASA